MPTQHSFFLLSLIGLSMQFVLPVRKPDTRNPKTQTGLSAHEQFRGALDGVQIHGGFAALEFVGAERAAETRAFLPAVEEIAADEHIAAEAPGQSLNAEGGIHGVAEHGQAALTELAP